MLCDFESWALQENLTQSGFRYHRWNKTTPLFLLNYWEYTSFKLGTTTHAEHNCPSLVARPTSMPVQTYYRSWSVLLEHAEGYSKLNISTVLYPSYDHLWKPECCTTRVGGPFVRDSKERHMKDILEVAWEAKLYEEPELTPEWVPRSMRDAPVKFKSCHIENYRTNVKD